MFSGIIEELGVLESVETMDGITRLGVAASLTTKDLSIGDSVAVNGVCLTAVAVALDGFAVEVMNETLDRSNLSDLVPGASVDLERAIRAGDRLDGHIVQGHVDGVGTVVARSQDGDAERVRIEMPVALERYLVEKGSIAVDGVSLTVTAVSSIGSSPAWFEVALIPHTLAVTVLGTGRPPGSRVNLEVDVLAKYVQRMVEAS
jgi:riboflavin synthase